jgi:hypothetical protein
MNTNINKEGNNAYRLTILIVKREKCPASGVPEHVLTTQLHLLKRLAPKSSVTTKSVRNIKNKIFAIEAAPAAMPPKPKMAAMMAMIKNVIDQRNIFLRV